ncbi:fumarylacetoacetate hydrolase family protein [Sphingobium fuliginis]|uniref:fumarylacetoacetate hydrolase family protein n=1 Tax=Sphingobium fuliginis (strain ATCC 27551) TaxID=336203 RepID=UPI001FCCA348
MLKDDGIVPLAELHDYPTMLSIVAGGETALGHIATFVASRTPSIPLSDAQLVCPIERPGKFLAIGMNYRKHAEEGERHGIPAPKQQLWFNKQTTCLSGPFDPIDPGVTEKLDYEVELGVIVGTTAKGVTASAARSHVFGYVVVNDVSARDWQFHSPTFTVGKSFDTHGPIGPWIVTADEIADPHDLRIRCLVNGEVRQDSNSNELIYNIWEQIAYLSTAFTLEPGDILATGTPEGVGVAMDPPRFLKPGDVVRCEVDKIGAIENVVSAP